MTAKSCGIGKVIGGLGVHRELPPFVSKCSRCARNCKKTLGVDRCPKFRERR